MNILIADDETAIARRLEKLLRQLPEVEIVNSRTRITDAVLALIELQPDLLILDHQFPNGTGLEIARKLQHYSPGTHVVVYSAFLLDIDKQRYQEAGIQAFIDKTHEVEELLECIQRYHTRMTRETIDSN